MENNQELAEFNEAPVNREQDNSFFAPEKSAVKNNPIGGGILLMVIAVVWFVVGYEAGLIFFYPPILFIFGLIAFLRGVFSGSSVGQEHAD